MSYLDETHARATIDAARLDGQDLDTLARRSIGRWLLDRFERFRRGAGHTVLGICRCKLCRYWRASEVR